MDIAKILFGSHSPSVLEFNPHVARVYVETLAQVFNIVALVMLLR